MPRYIDGEKLRNRISAKYTSCTPEFVKGFYAAFSLWNEELERMMNEESNVLEVKRGKWILRHKYLLLDYLGCSICGHITSDYVTEITGEAIKFKNPNFCPNCGAKMDGEEE